MRKSIIIIAIAAISALTTMLVAERQFSQKLQDQAALSMPLPEAVAAINDVSGAGTVTTRTD